MSTISFSGLASGIDGDAVIKAITDQRKLASVPVQNKIDSNTAENTALDEFNTKLLTLNDSLGDFRSLSGGAVAKVASVSDTDSVSATAGSDAAITSTSLTILNLAETAGLSFGGTFNNPDAAIAPDLASPTSIKITVGTGDAAKTVDVPVTKDTTFYSLSQAISDALPGQARASYVNVGTSSAPQYKFVINGLKTGVENGSLDVSVPPELQSTAAFGSYSVDQAEDAKVSLQGVGIVSRPTNQITDLIPGVTLDLKRATGGPIALSVQNDADKTAQKMTNLVKALNDVVKYSTSNSAIQRIDDSTGVSNKYGTLAHTQVDNRAVSAIRDVLAQSNSGAAGTTVKIFADLGITTEKDGTFKFDQQKFTDAVAADPTGTDALLANFADQAGSADGVLSNYTRFGGLIDTSTKSNDEANSTMNDRLGRLQASLDQQTQSLKLIFANLEQKVSGLNSSASALQSLITSNVSS